MLRVADIQTSTCFQGVQLVNGSSTLGLVGKMFHSVLYSFVPVYRLTMSLYSLVRVINSHPLPCDRPTTNTFRRHMAKCILNLV